MDPQLILTVCLLHLLSQSEDGVEGQLLVPKNALDTAMATGRVVWIDGDSDEENFIISAPLESEAKVLMEEAEARQKAREAIALPEPRRVILPGE